MSPLPIPVIAFFLFTVTLAFVLFALAVRGSKRVMLLCLVWIFVQSAVALSGFYLTTKNLPPRLLVAVAPPLVLIAALFLTVSGRRFIDGMSLKWSVLIHSIRILVEVNLYVLFLYKQVPALMTFESGNLDILLGLSAPLIWRAYSRGHVGRRGLLIWNALALLSVLNAFSRAILSAPFRFQQFAFDQPTVAILVFPFVLLPAFLVPAVLFCHFAVVKLVPSGSGIRQDREGDPPYLD